MSSSDKENRKKIEDEMTKAALQSRFAQETGQKARVERHSLNSERHDQLREVLRDVGRDIQASDEALKGLDYLGSLSVHVYASEIMGTVYFGTLSALDKLTFDLADGALRELNGTTKVAFSRSRQKTRSGF